MDITKPLPRSIEVHDPNGGVFEQAIDYDWIPLYCNDCLAVGHNCTKQLQAGPNLKIMVEPKRQIQKKPPKQW